MQVSRTCCWNARGSIAAILRLTPRRLLCTIALVSPTFFRLRSGRLCPLLSLALRGVRELSPCGVFSLLALLALLRIAKERQTYGVTAVPLCVYAMNRADFVAHYAFRWLCACAAAHAVRLDRKAVATMSLMHWICCTVLYR